METDNFNRLLGALHGLPEVVSTKPSVVQAVTVITGESEFFSVQTYRHEKQDTIFLQCVRNGQTIRMALPPAVAIAIARQRESLSARVRSLTAKRVAQERKDRGELPGFMKKKEVPG